MSRQQRIDFEGAVHHVMNRGVNHQQIFFDDADRIEFGRRLADIHERFGVETLAYCLMGNHYHLLLRTPTGGISAAMHRLASLYSRHTNDRAGRDGPLFRSRFHSILVATDAYLLTATRYIHRNPLDLRGVDSVSNYRWSSYPAYIGQRRVPSFVRTDLVLGCFSQDAAAFARFHDNDSVATLGHPSDAADIMQMIEFAIAEDDLLSGDDTSSPAWLERTITVLLVDGFPNAPWHAALVSRCSFASPNARRMAIARARHRQSTDPTVARVAARLESSLPNSTLAA